MSSDAGGQKTWDAATAGERIVAIVASKTHLPVTLQSPLDALGLDSLAMAEIIFEVEREFGIRSDDHLLDLRTIADVVDYVLRRTAK